MWGHISLPWRTVTQNWVTEVASFPPTTPRREAQLALGHVAKLQTHWRRRVIPALAWSRGILTYELQQSSTPHAIPRCHTSSVLHSGISGDYGLMLNHLPLVCSTPNKADEVRLPKRFPALLLPSKTRYPLD